MKKSGKKVVSAHVVPDSFIGSIKGAKYLEAFRPSVAEILL